MLGKTLQYQGRTGENGFVKKKTKLATQLYNEKHGIVPEKARAAAQSASPKVVRNRPLVTQPSTSIKAVVNSERQSPILSQTKENQLFSADVASKPIGNEMVTLELVRQKWETILEPLEKDASRVYHLLKNTDIQFDNNVIQVLLSTPHQVNLVLRKLPQLRILSKKILNNASIDLEIKAAGEKEGVIKEEKKTLYTQKDKYNYFKEKNPLFEELVQKLNLQL